MTRCIILFLLAVLLAPPVAAQQGFVVNGAPVDPQLGVYFASIGLPPGSYWIDGLGNLGSEGEDFVIGNVFSGRFSLDTISAITDSGADDPVRKLGCTEGDC